MLLVKVLVAKSKLLRFQKVAMKHQQRLNQPGYGRGKEGRLSNWKNDSHHGISMPSSAGDNSRKMTAKASGLERMTGRMVLETLRSDAA